MKGIDYAVRHRIRGARVRAGVASSAWLMLSSVSPGEMTDNLRGPRAFGISRVQFDVYAMHLR